ncbi:hypothetical protein QNH89_19940, partial [Escherichia coli]|uniref:hypothetical protein n=1 Tax=Escherichia coli TaxID=562 RepID=UPI002553872E
ALVMTVICYSFFFVFYGYGSTRDVLGLILRSVKCVLETGAGTVVFFILFFFRRGGIPEGVIPGVLFMIHPGRKPVSAIPGMMLFVRTWLCKI